MNVLVAVASKYGSTRDIGAAIADELRSTGLSVTLKDVAEVDAVTLYDAVVLGSAIYAGSWLPEARRFAERFRSDLTARPVWVWSSGPLGSPDPQPHDDPQRLVAPLAGVPIREHRIFEGKLDRDNLGLAERMIARVVNAPHGDFRDWDTIRDWARQIAVALVPAEAVAPGIAD